MTHGICLLSVVPLRSQPSDTAEMVSQLLFGEFVEVLEEKKSWLLVKVEYDAYEGWVDKKQILFIEEDSLAALKDIESFITVSFPSWAESKSGGANIMLPPGSNVFSKPGEVFSIEGNDYVFSGACLIPGENGNEVQARNNMLEHLQFFDGAPYMWGGKTPLGVDCSGLTQVIYKMAGIRIERDAGQQALQGKVISFLSEAKPGDLAFFDDDEGKIIHTGIIIDEQHIMHASGKVRKDRIDHQGIYNTDLKSYTHRLRLVKSYF